MEHALDGRMLVNERIVAGDEDRPALAPEPFHALAGDPGMISVTRAPPIVGRPSVCASSLVIGLTLAPSQLRATWP
jgi:hypothetical protein